MFIERVAVAMLDVDILLDEMAFEEKCRLITGEHVLGTAKFEKYNIPELMFSDGPHGIRRLLDSGKYSQKCNIEGGDTALPTASAMGASWDTDTAYAAGQAIAADCIEEGIDMLLAPGVNMKRTPHCGRNFEYFSEDPYLSGVLGAAFINGVQSMGVGTSLKHFAANNQEILRGTINAEIDERSLREYYLKVFEIVLKHSDPTSVMCAYNKLNGIWAAENKYLLTEILKETWEYNGMVISDWGAVHDSGKSIAAGLDFQMPKNPNITEDIRRSIENGIISEEDLDRAARSMLRFIDRIVSMRKPAVPYDRNKQHNIAYKAACEAITLLRNDRDILPITKDKYSRVAVLGECALTPVFMGGGSSKVTIDDRSVDCPYDCLADNSAGIEFDYIEIGTGRFKDESVLRCIDNIKNKYDAVICFVGDNYGPDCETESFDRDNIRLPNYWNALINHAIKNIDNFILVMQFGGAVIPYGWADAPAIVQMWYAGEACGRAVADVLLGKVNPSGKLSETLMLKDRTDIDYPGDGIKVCYCEKWESGYRYYDKHPDEIWFPFGHGISYTNFEYSDMVISDTRISSENFKVYVSFKLKNIGSRAGRETIQLYIAPLDSIVDRPVKELKRFAKVTLQPGEEKELTLELDNSDFEYYNTCLHEWHLESGVYNILIGASSRDIRLSKPVTVSYIGDYTIQKHNVTMTV